MSDLFKGVIDQSKISNEHQSEGVFYGDWSKFNEIEGGEYTDSMLQRLEMQKMLGLRNRASDDTLESINTIIKKLSTINTSAFNPDSIENDIAVRIDKLIMNFLSSGTWGRGMNRYNPYQNKDLFQDQNREQASIEIVKSIGQMLRQIDPTKQTISKTQVKQIQQLVSSRLKYISSSSKDSVYLFDGKRYGQAKGDLAEQIAADLIMQDETLVAIATGNIEAPGMVYKTKQQKWVQKNTQMLQDVFGFKRKDLNKQLFVGGELVKLTIQTNQGLVDKEIHTISDFLDAVQSHIGPKHIQLPAGLYDALLEHSVVKVQVKSGLNQNILNTNASNGTSLDAIGFYGNAIGELYNYYTSDGTSIFFYNEGTSTDTLPKVANYLLAQHIAETHLAGNDLYFTDQGLVSADEWMERTNKVLKFSTAVTKWNKSLPTEHRPYSFTTVK